MAFGGTNWGHSAAPVVYTSYDYSAPLRETRQQWNKLFQTKLVNMFATSSPDLLTTYMVGNGTGFRVSDAAVFTWVLKNPITGATFTVLQQAKTPSTANVSVSATLDTSAGMVTVSDVSLYGRQSKILVTDYTFGSTNLLYATADILTNGVFDTNVLVLYLKAGQAGELAFKDDKDLTFITTGSSKVTSSNNGTQQIFKWTQGTGTSTVKLSNGVLLYLLDQPTAWRFWAPSTTTSPYPSASQKIFVLGPYLVRTASISHQTLHISGDSDLSTPLEAYVGSLPITTIVWNGIRLPATLTPYGSYTAPIPGAESRTISLPPLDRWYSADSLPESSPTYDDSSWTVCNHTTTKSPIAPLTLPVLFSSDYGYYVGAKLYRGYFPSSSSSTSVNLTASGGLAFGWSAWLNGVHIGSHPGNATATTTSLNLALPPTLLAKNSTNVLTVLVDYHGHDESSTAKGLENPRGLLGATLLPGGTATSTGFTLWKIRGQAGTPGQLDPVRGPLNEGGLFAERMGWPLPGFAPSASESFAPPSSANSPLVGTREAGVRFYTTTFHLDLDSDLDVPLGVELSAPPGTVARVMVWVNGYQYGKFVPHVGPQTRFPVPPGVINNRGQNTLALSLWAQDDAGARLDGVRLIEYGRYQTDFGFNRDWSRLQPGWEDRSAWA